MEHAGLPCRVLVAVGAKMAEKGQKSFEKIKADYIRSILAELNLYNAQIYNFL